MRCSIVWRLLIVLGLVAATGVPGFGSLDPPTAEAEASGRAVTTSEVWTGLLAAPAGIPLSADDPTGSLVALVVRFRPGVGQASQVAAHQQAGGRRVDALALPETVRVEVDPGRLTQAISVYAVLPEVLYAEPDYEVRADYTPNDPQYPNQWALPKIGAPAAWDITRGAPSVKVAVIDCGVFSQATGRAAGDGQAGHPDLRGRVTVNQDFSGAPTGFDDNCNHGTHVAGIIGAAGNNSIGVSGLAPLVTVMNVKVLSDSGSGSVSTIMNGVVWAVQNGARVVNMSVGRDGLCSQAERDTMNWAWSQGAVLVASSGNSGLPASGAPANCDNVISVGSTTSADIASTFSNTTLNVDVAAPGSSILSTVRTGDYAYFNGTSMAAPHVAALAGLLLSKNPSATNQAVVDRIRTTAAPVTGTGVLWAWGRINAGAALNGWGGAATTPTATASPTATTTPTRTPTSAATATATRTPTRTPTVTRTATATPTRTPLPAPTRVACPGQRPPVQVTAASTGANTYSVTVRAGTGVVRQLDFRQLVNAAVTVGNRSNVTTPFVYQPTSYSNQLQFTITRQNLPLVWSLRLVIADDCGSWNTVIGTASGSSAPSGSINAVPETP